jgi:hypothetical protein
MLSGSNLPVPSQRPVANDSKLSTEDAVVVPGSLWRRFEVEDAGVG